MRCISGRIRMQFLCKPPLNVYYKSRFFSLIHLRPISESLGEWGQWKPLHHLPQPMVLQDCCWPLLPHHLPLFLPSPKCNDVIATVLCPFKSRQWKVHQKKDVSALICVIQRYPLSVWKAFSKSFWCCQTEGVISQTRCTAAQRLSNEKKDWSFTVCLCHPLPSCICDAALLSPASLSICDQHGLSAGRQNRCCNGT